MLNENQDPSPNQKKGSSSFRIAKKRGVSPKHGSTNKRSNRLFPPRAATRTPRKTQKTTNSFTVTMPRRTVVEKTVGNPNNHQTSTPTERAANPSVQVPQLVPNTTAVDPTLILSTAIIANTNAVTAMTSSMHKVSMQLDYLSQRLVDVEARQRNAVATEDSHYIFGLASCGSSSSDCMPETLGDFDHLQESEVCDLLERCGLEHQGSHPLNMKLLSRWMGLIHSRHF